MLPHHPPSHQAKPPPEPEEPEPLPESWQTDLAARLAAWREATPEEPPVGKEEWPEKWWHKAPAPA